MATYAAIVNNTIQATEDANILLTDFSEELVAGAEDLTIAWKYFRQTNIVANEIYGPVLSNDGAPVTDIVVLDDIQTAVYNCCCRWFALYIDNTSIEIPRILRIETPFGGIFIRKTTETEREGRFKHMFVTMDLPAEQYTSSIITIES